MRQRGRALLSGLKTANLPILFCLLAGETAIVWLVVRALLRTPGDQQVHHPLAITAAFLFLGALLPKVLESLDLWERSFGIVMIGAIALSTAIAVKVAAMAQHAWTGTEWTRAAAESLIFRPERPGAIVWGIVLLSAYAWWRGRLRAEPDSEASLRLFRAGIPLLFVAIVLDASIPPQPVDHAQRTAALLFFTASLLAIGLSRPLILEVPGSRLRSLLPAVIVVALALLAAAALTHDVVNTIVWAVTPVLWLATAIVRVVVLTIAIATLVILSPFLWLISGRTFDLSGVRVDTTATQPSVVIDRASHGLDDLPDPIRYLAVGLILFMIFAAVTRFVLRRPTRRRPGLAEETRRSLGWGTGWSDLAAWIAGLLARHHRVIDPLAELRKDARWRHTVVVRETYGEFLRWEESRGNGRNAGETVGEFGQKVTSDRPAATPGVDELSLVYQRARYGFAPLEEADAHAARRAWSQISRAATVAR